MKVSSARRGSALLVVLGMMAFIIVSAVAFSAFMRHSRLPSSYLRRSSSSRLLAKAALAEAIDLIDASIGNNPHPGIGTQGYTYPSADGQNRQRNYWTAHCFIGTNQMMQTSETVSTLNVEALAYIPPPLVNEARYYSRRSAAAAWHTFGFDSGRYAFFALDVSDCVDLNRVMADFGRDSSDTGRIRLGYAFENDQHSGYTMPTTVWDSFIAQFGDSGSKDSGIKWANPTATDVPLVSLADFNLAVADKAPAKINAFLPFLKAYGPNASRTNVKFVDSESGAEAELIRNLSIVTDSYFPISAEAGDASTSGGTGKKGSNASSSSSSETVDLSQDEWQPFNDYDNSTKNGFAKDTRDKNDVTLDQLMQQDSKFLKKFENNIGPVERVMLYDYLDRDSIPTTLALPTFERTPMITGVTLQGEFTVQSKKGTSYDNPYPVSSAPTAAGLTTYQITPYQFLVNGQLTVMAGCVFPFKYKRGSQKTFYAQAAATICFVEGDYDQLRMGNAAVPTIVTKNEWTTSSLTPTAKGFDSDCKNVIVMISAKKKIDIKSNILNESDAVCPNIELDFDSMNNIALESACSADSSRGFPQADTCAYRESKQYQSAANPGTGTLSWNQVGSAQSDFAVHPIKDNLSGETTPSSGKQYVPVVQVWVRILDENENVVDLVPACAADDKNPSELLSDATGSAARPLLRFYAKDKAVALGDSATFTSAGAVADVSTFKPTAYMTDDPRFNYAPENFWESQANFENEWLNNSMRKEDKRDGDIFMSVSDAGTLQSPFELTYLLRIVGLNSNGGDFGCLTGNAYDGKIASGKNDCAAGEAMWKSYCAFENNGGAIDDITALLPMTTGTHGFRMTPFASAQQLMAVFADTPLDWWAASPNGESEDGSEKQQMLGSLAEANKYTFSKHSGAQVQVEWDDLKEVAVKFRAQLCNEAASLADPNGDVTWATVFDDMAWSKGNTDANLNKLFGVDLKVPLHTVDRKFLHGFWRECMAARQQLFLVFLRAEPMMMGGGALNMSPPQLGARAVALVWRDPRPTALDCSGQPRPHRTRVLFYRQFD